VGGQVHSVAQASSRADPSKSRHTIVMGGLRSMRAQELQCVGGMCMRVHASTCLYLQQVVACRGLRETLGSFRIGAGVKYVR
jgi:hypothetical protein